jgi:HPt (histidine-containing phosphotransfer) domain-containing protein
METWIQDATEFFRRACQAGELSERLDLDAAVAEVAALAEAVNAFLDKIWVNQFQLGAKHEMLEKLLEIRTAEVRDILENIDQGLFTVNLDGTINPQPSRKTGSILQASDVAGSDVQKVLHLSEETSADWQHWIELVQQKHSTLRWEKLAKIAPVRELELGPPEDRRYVSVGYQKVLDSQDNLVRIMVLAQDVTETKRIEEMVATERARHEDEVKTILGLVNTLPEALQDYFEDLEHRIGNLNAALHELIAESTPAKAEHPSGTLRSIDPNIASAIFRDLHTIKGNSATYGFEKLTRAAHEAEELLEALQLPIGVDADASINTLFGKIERMEEVYHEIRETHRKLSGYDGVVLRLPEEKVENVRELAERLAHVPEHLDPTEVATLLEACRKLRDVPLSRLADKYVTMVRRLADRLGKLVRVEIVPSDLQMDPHFLGRFDEALVHLIRNSMDHAFESPEDREAAGKDPTGTLTLSVELNGSATVLTLSDDGRGIDGDNLVAKAIQEGILTPEQAFGMSWQRKIELVFESGLSTASGITDISGRGVGMDAVRRSLEAQGGSLLLESEPGKGTKAIMTIPVS